VVDPALEVVGFEEEAVVIVVAPLVAVTAALASSVFGLKDKNVIRNVTSRRMPSISIAGY
jgi:hypothetical protein